MKVLVVGCLHGHEQLGLQVIESLQSNPITGVDCLVGNPKAVKKKVRFIDNDLNRSFNLAGEGYEISRAKELNKQIKNYDYLIDIHTTTTNLKLTPIVADLSLKTRQILNLIGSKEIILMPKAISQNSLIGQFSSGAVSLEFSENCTQSSKAVNKVRTILDNLVAGQKEVPKERKIYKVSELIKEQVGPNFRNFDFIEGVGGYGVLINEKSYQGYSGFVARQVQKLVI